MKFGNLKGLRQFWENGKAGKLPPDQVIRIRQMLEVIDSAQNVPQDFEFFRSWKIHPLKGELKGYWSLTVKENWRIIFGFKNKMLLILIIWIIIKNKI